MFHKNIFNQTLKSEVSTINLNCKIIKLQEHFIIMLVDEASSYITLTCEYDYYHFVSQSGMKPNSTYPSASGSKLFFDILIY